VPPRAIRPWLLSVFACLAGATALIVPGSPAGGAVGPTCGGVELMKASGQPWVCTFDDEFNGTKLNRNRWVVQKTSDFGFRGPAACAVDSPRTVSVSNGNLNLTARRVAPFACALPRGTFAATWQFGSVFTKSFGQAYGRFAVRARFPQAHGVPGLQSAIWTYPRAMTLHKAITGTTEIDIAEAYSSLPDRAIPFVHYYMSGSDLNVTNNYCMITDVNAFHEYAVEWTKTAITILYDGQVCMVDKPAALGLTVMAPFDTPFYMILTQALGITGNAFNAATTPLPATTRVDYVRAWK